MDRFVASFTIIWFLSYDYMWIAVNITADINIISDTIYLWNATFQCRVDNDKIFSDLVKIY